MSPKIIVHLCADVGSDSHQYDIDEEYTVITVGRGVGVENVHYNWGALWLKHRAVPGRVHGVFANPVCDDFSAVNSSEQDEARGMVMVEHCLRIISECGPKWWVLENPATGTLKNHIGDPAFTYQPWHFGSPWTKQTALWGDFNIPERKYDSWKDVPQNDSLYIRPKRHKPNFTFLHKSAIHSIEEFSPFISRVKDDKGFRSLCSQHFAEEFKRMNP